MENDAASGHCVSSRMLSSVTPCACSVLSSVSWHSATAADASADDTCGGVRREPGRHCSAAGEQGWAAGSDA